MSALPEFVGTIHIFRGPCRGNPIGLYLRQEGDRCSIAPTATPWDRVVGVGETPNKAAADFDAKWKAGEVDPEMYSGPHWEGGIKPEKPKPPPRPSPPPTAATPDAAEQPQPGAAATASASPPPPPQVSRAVTAPPPSAPASSPAEGASDPPDAPPSQSTPSAQDDPAPPEHDPNHAS